jgi:hypothetical protein
VREHLDERVLDRFIGVVRIAQVVIRDPNGPSLLARHEIREALAGGVALPGDDERFDGAGELRVAGQGRPRLRGP